MSDAMPPMPSQWSGPPPYSPGRPPRALLPVETPVYTPWIWILAIEPLVRSPLVFLNDPDVRYRMIGRYPTIDYSSIFTPGYFALLGLGLVLYALIVVLSLLDYRVLRSRGVERPFHWAWSFLAGIVYVIGRSVIVHRVARPRGLVPVWVITGAYVVGVVVSTIWVLSYVAEVFQHFPLPTR